MIWFVPFVFFFGMASTLPLCWAAANIIFSLCTYFHPSIRQHTCIPAERPSTDRGRANWWRSVFSLMPPAYSMQISSSVAFTDADAFGDGTHRAIHVQPLKSHLDSLCIDRVKGVSSIRARTSHAASAQCYVCTKIPWLIRNKRRLFPTLREPAGCIARFLPPPRSFKLTRLLAHPPDWETEAAWEREQQLGGERKRSDSDGEHQHGPETAAAAAAAPGTAGLPCVRRPRSQRRRGPERGRRVQDEERHRVGAAVFEGKRPEHHAQPVGLRAEATVLRSERFSRRRRGGGRPGEHRAALLRPRWVSATRRSSALH